MTKTTMSARELAIHLANLIHAADIGRANGGQGFDPDAPLIVASDAGIEGVQGFALDGDKLILVDTVEPVEVATPDFAKLYRFPFGQVLVERTRTEEDEKPAVSFSVNPPGLGVCSASVSFDSEEKADLCFASVTGESALVGIGPLMAMIDKLAQDEEA